MLRLLNKYCFYYPVVSIKTKSFFRNFKDSVACESEPLGRLQEKQIRNLQKILIAAQDNCLYYREIFKSIDPLAIKSLSDLEYIPTLNKNTLKEQHARLVSSKKYYLKTTKTTGGSTGQPVTIVKSRTAMGYELAATWRGYSWAGISIGDKQARFWGVPMTRKGNVVASLTDLTCNRKRLSAFSFNEQTLARYTRQLNTFKPDFFYGYVSMLTEYADYLLQNNITPHFRPKVIITTSEVLYPEQRRQLQKAFTCKRIHDEYGCGELGTIAHECEAGNMHVSADNMIVEILNGDVPCKAGEVGEIVVTELRNYAMPLIRYRLGDFARFSDQVCPCGRTLPVIQEIKGRTYDTITLADGRKFHGEYFMYVMEEAEKKQLGIRKFQIVQKTLTDIEVKILPSAIFSNKGAEFIIAGIKRQLDSNITVAIKIVDDIPREKSGKMRLIVGL